MFDAVDVGRVDEGEALGDVLVRDHPDPERLDPRERALAERRHVVRVGEDDGRPRRWAQDAGGTRRLAGNRVEERALACPRRSEDEHDDRRVQAAGADAEVACEVIAEPGGAGSGSVGRRPRR